MAYLMSFRLNRQCSYDLLDSYLTDRLQVSNFDYVWGSHPTSGTTPHDHVHCILSDPPNNKTAQKHPAQDFKNYLLSINDDSLSGKRVFSLKYSVQEDLSKVRRFMQYPLKEGILVSSRGFSEDQLFQMKADAIAEYKAKLVYEQKEREKQALLLSKKQSLFSHLDTKQYASIVPVLYDTLSYYKEDPDAPHPKTQLASAEMYAYRKGIWTFDDIILRYYPQLKQSISIENNIKNKLSD